MPKWIPMQVVEGHGARTTSYFILIQGPSTSTSPFTSRSEMNDEIKEKKR